MMYINNHLSKGEINPKALHKWFLLEAVIVKSNQQHSQCL